MSLGLGIIGSSWLAAMLFLNGCYVVLHDACCEGFTWRWQTVDIPHMKARSMIRIRRCVAAGTSNVRCCVQHVQPHRHVLYSAILTAFVACVLDCWEGASLALWTCNVVGECVFYILYGMSNVMACQKVRSG